MGSDGGDHLLVLGPVHVMAAGKDEQVVFLAGSYGSVQLSASTTTSRD